MKAKNFFIPYILFIFHPLDISADPLYERIYVQTDKQLYLSGEPVLMKFVTTNTEQIPIAYSKIAYAELVSDTMALLQIKVELTGGAGAGRMLLPADLPTGYYRVIAYTQNMRNEGADVFFEKNIAVLNTFQSGYHPAEEEHALPNPTQPVPQNFKPETLNLKLDQKTYMTRTHGELTVNGLPQNIYTLAVSIAGKDCIPDAESDISLFQKNQTKKPTAFSGKFLPEYEGHIVTGKLIDNQTGVPATSDIASLSTGVSFPTGDGIRYFSGQKTETGDIRFCTSSISGTNEIATVVFRADERYRVDIQSPFVSSYAHTIMPSLQVHVADYEKLLDRSVALQLFRYFADDTSELQTVSEPHFKMKPTNSYLLDEYTRFSSMREMFIEFIRGARFRTNEEKQELSVFNKTGSELIYGSVPLVLLDGVPITDHNLIYHYDPLTVEKINIYYGPCIFGSSRFDGIVEMVTFRRLHANLNLNRSVQITSYDGTQLPYRLNIPDYSKKENIQKREPDGRHTLLWEPEVKTNGKTSIRLPFNTSDLTGEFQVTVEGITGEGQFIFATGWFQVVE